MRRYRQKWMLSDTEDESNTRHKYLDILPPWKKIDHPQGNHLNGGSGDLCIWCPTLELRDVAFRPKFLGKIGLQAIVNLFELIHAKCKIIKGYTDAESAIRDIKDLYLLSMAESIPADYLVTGDQDLLVLKNHLGTKIITFAEFVSMVQGNLNDWSIIWDSDLGKYVVN